MIVVNFKNYVYKQKALELVRTIDIYCNKAIVAVPIVDLMETAKNTTLPIFAQHVDFQELGRGTGYNIPEFLKEAGAQGSLLNHSEHKLSIAAVKKTINRCRDIGFKLIICVSNLNDVEKIKKLSPYAIAFEDPNLIESGKSITTHKTHDVEKFSKILQGTDIIPLCGAGISSGDDVKKAYDLGCKGILVSSVIANNPHPEEFLKEVASVKT
ncbi:MAG: triose-phosphate isomerase [Nanoarchaeota archaeon]